MDRPLRLYLLPISGGYFTVQIAELMQMAAALSLAKIDASIGPDIVMCASGGAVCGFIGLASDWKIPQMMSIARSLTPGMFAVPWIAGPRAANAVVGLIKGTMFTRDPGDPCSAFFESLLDPERIQNGAEMWVGTVDRLRGRPRLFCSKSENKSILNNNSRIESLLGCLPHLYMDCDPSFCAQAVLASASIPVMVPPVEIEGNEYSDGGGAANNPFVYLRSRLPVTNRLIEITLFSCSDMDREAELMTSNIYSEGMTALDRLQLALALAARLSAIEHLGGNPTFEEGNLTDARDLGALIVRRRTAFSSSLLELIPTGQKGSVKMTDFVKKDIENAINYTRRENGLKYRLWYNEK